MKNIRRFIRAKAGFTILELAIVIVIIAILAAVMIPSISGIVGKANESKDTLTVRNLNMILATDREKHETMFSVMSLINEYGYDVGNLRAAGSGCDILWDSKNDCFVYFKNGAPEYPAEISSPLAEDEYYKFWKIYTNADEISGDGQKFSIYMGTSFVLLSELCVGVDTGSIVFSGDINYIRTSGNARAVIFRTCGGHLTVNAPLDTVSHFGSADRVDIIAVYDDSYHEYGVSKLISIESGHIVAENGSLVVKLEKAPGVSVTEKGEAEIVIEHESGNEPSPCAEHEWVYVGNDFRYCKNCGECESIEQENEEATDESEETSSEEVTTTVEGETEAFTEAETEAVTEEITEETTTEEETEPESEVDPGIVTEKYEGELDIR